MESRKMASKVWSGKKTGLFFPEPRRRISPENGENVRNNLEKKKKQTSLGIILTKNMGPFFARTSDVRGPGGEARDSRREPPLRPPTEEAERSPNLPSKVGPACSGPPRRPRSSGVFSSLILTNSHKRAKWTSYFDIYVSKHGVKPLR